MIYYKEISKNEAKKYSYSDDDYSDITIGIVTALPKEYAALVALLSDVKLCKVGTINKDVAGERIYNGFIEASDGSGIRRVAIALLPKMGNNFASIVATKMQMLIPSIQNIIVCGIAGGMPNDVHLGDIVVATNGIIEYDFGTEKNDSFTPKEVNEHCSDFLLEAVRFFELDAEKSWPQVHAYLLNTKPDYMRPKCGVEEFYTKNEQGEYVKVQRKTSTMSKIVYGEIASGNAVQKNPFKRDQLYSEYHVSAIEMEGAGINHATRINGNGYLAIRGICDFCDKAKSDVWQKYSAGVAAAYTIALLKSVPIK